MNKRSKSQENSLLLDKIDQISSYLTTFDKKLEEITIWNYELNQQIESFTDNLLILREGITLLKSESKSIRKHVISADKKLTKYFNTLDKDVIQNRKRIKHLETNTGINYLEA